MFTCSLTSWYWFRLSNIIKIFSFAFLLPGWFSIIWFRSHSVPWCPPLLANSISSSSVSRSCLGLRCCPCSRCLFLPSLLQSTNPHCPLHPSRQTHHLPQSCLQYMNENFSQLLWLFLCVDVIIMFVQLISHSNSLLCVVIVVWFAGVRSAAWKKKGDFSTGNL